MSARNPPTLDELRDWCIAYVDVQSGYIGRFAERQPTELRGETTLSPAYVFTGGYQIGPQGFARTRFVFPIELLENVDAISVRHISRLFLRDLSSVDFDELGKTIVSAIATAEQMRAAIRSRRSGIIAPPRGLKV